MDSLYNSTIAEVKHINGVFRKNLAKHALTWLLLLIPFGGVWAAANGDFRTIASGDWSNVAIWEKYNGSVWLAAPASPTYSDKVITIQSGDTVTISSALSIDQTTVETNACIILNNGVTLTLKKNANPDLKIYGTFRNAGTVTITSGTGINYYSGGIYQHNYTTTSGTIPVGTWNSGSTCEIWGYSSNTGMPSGMNQTFSDFKWNCLSQAADVNFAGGLTSFTGNFIVASTGSNALVFSGNNLTFSLTGNLTVTGGILSFNNGASRSTTFNQTGNLSVTGGVLNFSTGSSATGSINLTGNYSQSGGTFDFSQGASGTCTLNISGNWSHTGGTLQAGGGGSAGQVTFNKTGVQTFTAGGNTVTGNVDYTVNSASVLNTGTSIIRGRNFTLSSGGELQIGSPDGITAAGALGNIQVSGTRSLSSGAYYTYSGSGSQVTGDGLPASINKLTVNNGALLTLTNNVTVTNILSLLSGRVVTATNEIHVTNTSGSAITGNSNSSYVAGNLRRTVSASGTFSFPVGSVALYQPMSVTLTGTSGFTTMIAGYVNTNPNDTAYPMTAIVNGNDMTEMLDNGYWTLSPNSPLTGGTYSIQLNEQGYSNTLSSGTFFSLLARNNSSSPWSSVGTHNDNTQGESGGVVTAVRSGLTSFFQYGIAVGPYLFFSSPVLQSGTAGTVGAVYLFSNVMANVDAWVEIMNLYNGAVLSDIDNNASGYSESFQPFVDYPAEKESYIEWRIKFKKGGTSVDTTLKKVKATGVDVDGGYTDTNNDLREFVVATMPTSYSLDSATLLTMSNDSGRYKAIGPTTTITNIDTAHHEVMYQLNYENVNTLLYRTGAINTYNSTKTRQTSLYFRSFLYGSPVYALPIELVEFKAKRANNKVLLSWTTASESNNDYFTVERSPDGINFSMLLTLRGAGNSTGNLNYEAYDEYPLPGLSYYRLKQTDYDGKNTYSKIVPVNFETKPENGLNIKSLVTNSFNASLEMEFTVKSKGLVEISLMSSEGKILERKTVKATEGSNHYRFESGQTLNSGSYLVVVEYDKVRVIRRIVWS